MTPRVHGGTDAQGPARWDFSTCANAAGPCPAALSAVQDADPSRYPDPSSSGVRHALAALHGVEPSRVLPAASASEFIQRITAVTGRLWPGAVRVPHLAYGDYAIAAAAWGRAVRTGPAPEAQPDDCTLTWFADPSSPLGHDDPVPAVMPTRSPAVLDAVYAPLRLQGESPWTMSARESVFVLHSPNKALGLSGVRGAYAIAPRRVHYDVGALCAALEGAAPSWPLSAHADAMLRCWATPAVQSWVTQSRATLALWREALHDQLRSQGFELMGGVTPHFVVRPPRPVYPTLLRRDDVAVRDAASFGLPGCWRVSAQPPAAQAALLRAWLKAIA